MTPSSTNSNLKVQNKGDSFSSRSFSEDDAGEYPGRLDPLQLFGKVSKDGTTGKFRYVSVRYHSTKAGSELSELTVGCGGGSLP